MLPDRLDDSFPAALKKAREQKQLSLTELAERAGISSTMPGRYENRGSKLFTPPSLETWRKLNAVLFPEESQDGTVNDKEILLSEASVEQLINQLKKKGAQKLHIEF